MGFLTFLKKIGIVSSKEEEHRAHQSEKFNIAKYLLQRRKEELDSMSWKKSRKRFKKRRRLAELAKISRRIRRLMK